MLLSGHTVAPRVPSHDPAQAHGAELASMWKDTPIRVLTRRMKLEGSGTPKSGKESVVFPSAMTPLPPNFAVTSRTTFFRTPRTVRSPSSLKPAELPGAKE